MTEVPRTSSRQRWTLVLVCTAEFSGAALARALGFFGATLGGASAVGLNRRPIDGR